MIIIDVHDNPDNIAKEKDITFYLANFNSENIDSLAKITFNIEDKVYHVVFNIVDKIEDFPYNCPTIMSEDIKTLFKNFFKATNFMITKKLGQIELVVNDYNLAEKAMLLGGKWRKKENV